MFVCDVQGCGETSPAEEGALTPLKWAMLKIGKGVRRGSRNGDVKEVTIDGYDFTDDLHICSNHADTVCTTLNNLLAPKAQ